MTEKKILQKQKRHWRIRRKVIGNMETPRMSVYRSLKHMYVQLIDDISGKSLISCSTLSKKFKEEAKGRKNNKESAAILGKLTAEMALSKNIKKVAFDRGGYKYHGKVQAIADAARKAGLKF